MSVQHGKNFNAELIIPTFEQNSFIPALFVGIINHYLFLSLSVALTLVEGHKVSRMQNISGPFSPTVLTDQNKV